MFANNQPLLPRFDSIARVACSHNLLKWRCCFDADAQLLAVVGPGWGGRQFNHAAVQCWCGAENATGHGGQDSPRSGEDRWNQAGRAAACRYPQESLLVAWGPVKHSVNIRETILRSNGEVCKP